MPKDVCTVELPESGTTQTINLTANQVNTLSFPKSCIVGDPKLNADGSVTMDLINGSSVVIENFEEMADAGKSCGRDTLIQLSDNAIIYPEELYSQLTSVADATSAEVLATVAPAAGEAVTVNAPATGSQELSVQAGQDYQFGFDLADVTSMTQQGSDLVLTFGEGQTLIMTDYFTMAQGALPPSISLSDGSVIDAASLLPTYLASRSEGNTDGDDMASLNPNATVLPAEAAIEPASGEEDAPQETVLEVVESTIVEEAPEQETLIISEEVVEEVAEQIVEQRESEGTPTNVDVAALAEQLAEIEPAAGETGGAAGSRGGFGFQSGVDDAPLINDPAIGPHGYTALEYDIPEFQDEPFAQRSSSPTPPFDPPKFSIPSLVVKEDSSVDVVIDAPSPSPTDTLTVEIDVPVGWTVVDLNGGTYDAGTGIWTFTTAAGDDFLGGPEVAPPADSDIDSEVLDVRVTRTDTTTGQTATSLDTYTILTDAVADTPDVAASNATGEEGTTIPLNITTSTTDVDGSEVIAVVRITNVPAGMTLTAGTEVAPGEWELDVTDLAGLGINVPDGTTGSFTLVVESVADEDPVTDGEFDPTDNQASNFTELLVTVTPDDVPLPVDEVKLVDETNLVPGPLTTSGTVTVDFGADGPGLITPNAASTFTVNGSVAGGTLSSNGSPITVTLAGNTYTGTAADGRDIFTMTVGSNGSYTFELLDSLDHEDAANPNDIIDLHFSYEAEDTEGDTTNGLITIRVADDAPIAVDDTDSLSDTETVTTGNVRTNDDQGEDTPAVVTEVEFNGVTVPVPATGTVTVTGDYGVLTLAADGSYTYTRSTDDAGVDVFSYTLTDFDGDSSQADLTITLEDADDKPVVSKGFEVVDETDLPGVTESGQLVVDFGTDGPGTVVANDSFTSSGSRLGDNLSSNGDDVEVVLIGNQYVGRTVTGGETVFTLTVETDGSYEFNLIGTLDHADPNDPNDIINLEFGVVAIDADQDETPSTITVLVKDDVPTIGDSRGDVDETDFDTGNLVYSDTLFTDFGTEVASFAPAGNVRAEVSGAPFALTSGLEPVTLVQTATGYEGTTATSGTVFTLVMDFTTGQYVYTQIAPFDHPDGNDHNDTIELLFDFTIENTEGDTDTGTVTISVADDGPKAHDDTNGAAEGQDITGSVTANDELSEDSPNNVTQVEYAGTTYSIVPGLPAVVATPLGELTLNYDGSYSFDAVDSGDPDGTVVFTYTLVDSDGDSDTATLSIKVTPDGEPIIVSGENTVDETALTPGPLTVNGSLSVDFGLDGAGNVNPNGTTSFGGSATAGNLTSNDVPVEIRQTATGYEGVLAGTDTQVFELVLQNNGDYSFELFGPLDHADGSDPNDVIQLNFGVTASDFGGDTDDAVVTIHVLDDAPIANDDFNMYDTTVGTASGNVITGLNGGAGAADDLSEDNAAPESADHDVVEVSFNGTTVTIPEGGSNTIEGDYGILTMYDDGTYSYELKPGVILPGSSSSTLDPQPSDVSGTQSTITKNGITVTSVNGGDLTFTDDGIGINDGSGTARVYGNDEKLNVTFDNSQSVTLTMGDLGNNPGSAMDFVVYLSDGSTRTVEVPVSDISLTNSAGSVTFTGADYGAGLTITGVDVFSHSGTSYSKTSFSLVEVETTQAGDDCIADVFEYVLQDGDGDQSTATLTLKGKDLTNDEPEIGDGEKTVDETDLGPIAVSGTVSSDFGADGPGTITPTGVGSFSASGSVAGTQLTSGGVPVTVEVVGNTYVGSAGTETIFTLAVENDGDFTFNLIGTLDHADTANHDDIIDLAFGVTGEDEDGDTDTGTIVIHVKDDGPYINDKFKPIDESNLDGAASISYTHTLDFDFGEDGSGEITPTGNFQALFQMGGTNQPLTSGGLAISVNPTANGYEGTLPNGDVVFDLVVNATTGEYTYTQYEPVDHPDENDHDDVIWLKFEVQIEDADGDTDTAIIGVDLHDDGPKAHDDCHNFKAEDGPATGNVITGLNGGAGAADDLSVDVANTVKQVIFGTTVVDVPETGTATIQGDNGVLEISADGSYTYTLDNPTATSGGTVYSLDPTSGDVSGIQETLSQNGITVTIPNSGDFDISWVNTADGSGLGIDNLNTSDSKKVWPKGESFDISAAENAQTMAITIAELGNNNDDGNHGIDYVITLADGTTVAGEQQFVPAQIVNGHFTFTLDAADYGQPIASVVIESTNAGNYDGASFLLNNVVVTTPGQEECAEDQFTYVLQDGDGDTSSALLKLKATLCEPNDQPEIGDDKQVVDETNLGPIAVSGVVSSDFGTDGPGTITPEGAGSFVASGSVAGGTLTSGGVPVTVDVVGNSYVGTAGAQTIFTLDIQNDGSFTFNLIGTLDHGDTRNHDDVIDLVFGVTGEDEDGDTDTGTITICVKDDGPCAVDDYYIKVGEGKRVVDGNIMANDHVGADLEGSIANIIQDGMQYPIPKGGALILAGDYGKLTIDSEGTYSYERTTNDCGIERFKYTLQDADGDTDVAWFKFQVYQGCLNYGPDNLQLNGTAGNDLIVGNDDDNVIDAGAGDNLIYGEGGADTFLFEQADVDASVDRVADFNSGEGDVLDLSDFLQSYNPVTEAIEDFVFQREVNGDTVISVDTSGSGDINNAVDLVVLENVSGEDLDQLVLNAQTTV